MTDYKVNRRQLLKAQAAMAAAAVAGLPVSGRRADRHGSWPERADLEQGALSVLRHGMRRPGGNKGRAGGRDAWGREGGGQSRPQLRERLFPLQDHVWRGSAHAAPAAQEKRQIRQNWRLHAGHLGRGIHGDGRAFQGRPQEGRPFGGRYVRFRPVDDLGGVRGFQAVQGRFPHQQPRSQCAPLHGIGCGRLHAFVRHRRADGLLR